ncbi:MAG: DUF4126 domain-containing protein [Anaerolineae bacterium]
MFAGASQIVSAFGLSTSAGLNAYVPLLVVALIARFTHLVKLRPPFDALTSWWVIGLLVVLLIIEIVADKVPIVDTANDTVQTIVRPAAGAILFAASTNAITEVHPVLTMVCGILLAGGVHAVKATARPVLTATTGGTLNPLVSTVEDVTAAVLSLLSLLVPLLVVGLLLALVVALVLLWRRRTSRATASRG